MPLDTDDFQITLAKVKNKEQSTFSYPFNANEIGRWLGQDEAEMVDSFLPFTISYPVNFNQLNEKIALVDSSDLGNLLLDSINEVVSELYGSWKEIENPEELTIVEEYNDNDFAVELQERIGWDVGSFILGGNALDYVDWDRVARDIKLQTDVIETNGYYIQR